ncbi:PepSY-associated TM helix domain-containing protein [Aquisalimonas asiatica]|uniref:Uncharacterized iron-regulated membrane protein n=1 Tax=Aquisalimonas asiatica TaxID=406100 RepID=A0A1H8SYD9_9GAMM|nr:PepSY-associated TM helix domain-containing protein [Aquisalimonas asiatica]SEO83711.1 Uncharacterized iron-regulated membrane protein [Aquisalimonas asiatica]
MKGGFRQSMAWVHTWAGLTLGWVLFFMFVTGTAGYFDTEIDRWMQPELPMAQHDTPATDVAAMGTSLLEDEAPDAARWVITLPIDRNEPYPRRFWQGADPEAGAVAASGNERFDATTGEPFNARATGGGQLLYQMHWRLHYLPRAVSDWLIGLATMFMLVAITTGIIIHKKIFKDFFTFRPGKGQRSWLDAHNVLSVLALPFHVMITYSGLIFMAFAYMPLVIAAIYGTDPEARQTAAQEVFSVPAVERSGESAPLTPLAPLIDSAEERWGPGVLRHVDIHHPGDRNAVIILRASHAQGPVRSGEELHFDGVSGELIDTVPAITSAPQAVWTTLLGLHEGLFAGPVLRWLYFFFGLLGTAMVGTGLVLWTVKRRQQAERKADGSHRGLVLVERLNPGMVAGLFTAVAAYFWANRLMPSDFPAREAWEAHALFLTWLVVLVASAARPPSRAWREQFALAGAAFASLPLLNLITTERHLGASLAAGDWPLAGFDLTALGLGAILAIVAWKLARRAHAQDRARAEATASHTHVEANS